MLAPADAPQTTCEIHDRLSFLTIKNTNLTKNNNQYTTLSNGYLGSHNDEERSEMRYVMRIAEFSESSNL
jgi:hypothetical protein